MAGWPFMPLFPFSRDVIPVCFAPFPAEPAFFSPFFLSLRVEVEFALFFSLFI